jgi:hypothetical protein
MSTEEPKTWRELLRNIIRNAQERQRIAHALGVNVITLMRWATYKSTPRQDKLRQLLEILPQYRQQLSELIAIEYPHISLERSVSSTIPQEIPAAFYARVLSVHTTSPSILRTSSLCTLILQQIQRHLDPGQSSIIIFIAQCMQSRWDGKVHSLRKTFSRGSFPWNDLENRTFFLGAESQAGQAVISGHPVLVNSHQEKMRSFPTHQDPRGESMLAFPLLFSDRTAGCLAIISTQRNYFSQAHLDLMQNYVNLLVLAFEDHEFYNLHNIVLGILPSSQKQLPLLTSFQRRVMQHMIRATQQHESLTRAQAETLSWQELEEELRSWCIDTNQE